MLPTFRPLLLRMRAAWRASSRASARSLARGHDAPQGRMQLEELEPRLLYSADSPAALMSASVLVLPEAGESVQLLTQQDSVADTAASSASAVVELVVIDGRGQDTDALVASLRASQPDGRRFEVIVAGAGEDGLALLSQALAGQQDIGAVHLVGHGQAGLMQLGSSVLDGDALQSRSADIAAWAAALAADADILLYGCDVASTPEGEALVAALARLTGADVAASDDATGAFALGGDWTLEHSVGTVDTRIAFSTAVQQSWSGVLAITANGTVTSTSTVSASSLTWSHTVAAGDNRALFVELAIDGLGANATSVTYGGVALTQVGRATGNHAVEIWRLVNPTVGTANVVATFAGSTAAAGGATTFNGVSQTSPTGTFAGATGTGTTASVNVASAVGDRVIDVQYWSGMPSGGAVGAGQTLQWSLQNASMTGGSTTEAGAATVTMSGSFTSSAQWEIGAVSIRAAAGITVTPTSGLSTTEAGGTAQFSVVLDRAPTANVTIGLSSSDTTEGTVSVSGLTFTTANWSTPQLVTVTGIDDGFIDGNVAYTIVTAAAVSADSAYNGLNAANVSLANTDGDTFNTLVVDTASDVLDGNTTSISALMAGKGADGKISLREAIAAANNTANGIGGADVIAFAIGTGSQTISLASALPTITGTLIIDGWTQPGYAGAPLIVLDANQTAATGLRLSSTADGSRIRGLVLRDFSGNAIQIDSGSDGNTIEGNYIGSFGSAGTDLGVTEANLGAGISVAGADNVLGGTSAASRNVIGGNASGILITGTGATGNQVIGNLIGVQADGTTALGNSANGVVIDGGASGNQIGGVTEAERNTIAYNGADGIHVAGATSVSNAALGNRVYANAGEGIDLNNDGVTANDAGDADTGANSLQNFPVLTSARTDGSGVLILTGLLNSTPSSHYRVEFFANDGADASGYGEGQRYLGFADVATDASGNATISTTLSAIVAAGQLVTATATRSDPTYTTFSDTSEFAKNVVAASSAPPVLSVTGNGSVRAGDAYTLNLSASDADGVTITSWTVNWGDGTITTHAGNPSSVTHTYSNGLVGRTLNVSASATDADGTHYGSDLLVPEYGGSHELQRYDGSNGIFLGGFAEGDGLLDPAQVITGPDGNLYVSGFSSGNVLRYTAGGAYIDTFVPAGSGGMGWVAGIAFGPDGHLYAASSSTSEVLRFDGTTGAFIDAFVTAGSGGIGFALGIVFGSDGDLYVAAGDQIARFDGVTGASLGAFVSSGSGGLATAEHLTFGPDGDLFVADFSAGAVRRYDGATGAFVGDFVTGLDGPAGVAFGPDGRFYIGEETGNRISRYDGTTGAYIDDYVAAGLNGLAGPAYLSFAPDVQVRITAANQAPIADAGGPYSIAEGGSLTLNAAASTDPDAEALTYAWDLDNDGNYGEPGEPGGVAPTVSWATLQSFGIDDDGSYTIGLRVSDGALTGTATATLTVTNAAPALDVTGSGTATAGRTYTLLLDATDPGADVISGWIINWGDGNVETVAGDPSSVTHTYVDSGFTYNILVSAIDEDGAFTGSDAFVSSLGNDSVIRLDGVTGELLGVLPVNSSLDGPGGSAFGPDGRLYVAGYNSDNVVWFDIVGGTTGVFVSAGSAGLSSASDLAFGPDGNLYVASYDTDQVLRYDGVTGAFIDAFVNGGVDGPSEVLFGPDGNLYVGGWFDGSIYRFDGTTGALIGGGAFVTKANGFGLSAFGFGPDGHLYVADGNFSDLLKYDGTTGAFIATIDGSISGQAVEIGPDGSLYVPTLTTPGRIERFDAATGSSLGFFDTGVTGIVSAFGLSFLPAVQVTVLPDPAPIITGLSGDALNYSEGDGAVVIDQGGDAQVSDVDSTDFDGGVLTVAITTGAVGAEDLLGIRNQGSGAGQIGLSARSVTYGGTVIGQVTGGTGGSPLVITFNADATPVAVTALLRNVTYQNANQTSPTAGSRTVRFAMTDGDGESSTNHDATVTVSAVNDAPTFSPGDGKLTTTFATSADIRSVVVQPDGKIVAAGFAGSAIVLARYNADGTLDSTFGTAGKVSTVVGSSSEAWSVALQADGRILVAGTTFNGSNYDFALVRYNADGSLDTGFDTDGKVTTAIGTGEDRGVGLVVQDDGRIVVAGYSHNGSNQDFALARYNTDGSLDTSFSDDGRFTSPIGSGDDIVTAVVLQADGRIVVGGYSFNGTDNDFALLRVNTDGSLDTGFDGDGKVTTAIGTGLDQLEGLAVQDDGRIVAVGTTQGASSDIALVRYNSDGSLDTGFDGDGKLVTVFSAGDDYGSSVAIQTDGRIVVAGRSLATGNADYALARYNGDGTLDTSFDADGKLTTDFAGSGDLGRTLAIQPDGKLVVAGMTWTGAGFSAGLTRYNANGTLDAGFDSAFANALDGTPAFTEGGSVVVLDGNVGIFDVELSSLGNFDGATLTLARAAGERPEDVFAATGALSTLTEGGNLMLSGAVIGTVTTNSGGRLVLTFNGNATNAGVNSAMRLITYRNMSDAPPASVQIDWTINDGNTGAQGSGGALQAVGSTTVTITAVNDAPVDIVAVNGLPASSLIGAYTFGSAAELGRDDAGGDAPISLFGAPAQTTTPGGSGALDLAGGASGQYGNITGITTGGAMSIAAQVRFDSMGDWQRVVDFGQTDSTGITAIYVGRLGNSSDLTFTLEKNLGGGSLTTYRATASGVIADGVWLHFAATVDDAGMMSLYVNGNLAQSAVAVVPESGVRDNNFIGRSNWSGDTPFDGAIDNLVITQGALTAGQVAALYQQGNAFSVAEMSANGTVLGTVVTSDPDAGDSPTYTLVDNAGGRFAIASDGTITVADGSLLDYEAAASHVITVRATDTGGLSRDEVFTIALSNVNEAPVLGFVTGSASYTEGSGAVVLAPSATVSDVDSADFDGGVMQVAVTANGQAEDRIAIRNQGTGPGQIGVSGANVSYGGTVIGSFSGGTDGSTPLVVSFNASATLAAVQALVRNITYQNVSDVPSTSVRTIQGFVTDGDGGTSNSASGTLSIVPVNDVPSGSDGTITVTEDTAYTFVLADFGFVDVDGHALMRVHFDSVPGTGTLRYSGIALGVGDNVTRGDILAGLLTYTPADHASGSAQASFAFRVQDDGGTANGGVDLDATPNTITIDITPVNDAPVNAMPGLQVTPLNTPLVLGSAQGNAVQVSDIDAGAGAVQLSLSVAHGTLSLATTADLSFSTGDGTADASLVFSGTLAAVNAALDGLSYTPTTAYEGGDTLTLVTSDLGNTGAGGVLSDSDSLGIQVGARRFQEGIDGYTGTQDTYLRDNAPTSAYGSEQTVVVDYVSPLSPGLIRFDNLFGAGGNQIPAGSTITSATLSVYVLNRDNADIVTLHRMLAPWSEGSTHDSLTSGVQYDNVEAVSAALATIDAGLEGWVNITGLGSTVQAWASGEANHGWVFQSDGADAWTFASSEYATAALRPYLSITYTPPPPPVVVTSGGAAAYVENAAGVAVDPGLTLSDADSTELIGATVAITGAFVAGQDVLGFVDQSGITGSYDAGTGVLTLSGTATIAQYQSALRSVSYANGSDAPATVTRTVSFSASDAFVTSATATRSVTVSAVNDAPGITDSNLAAVPEGTASPPGATVATLFGAGFTDPDAGASLAGIVITENAAPAAEGQWQYSTDGGGNWLAVGSVGVSGLALDAASLLRFVPDSDYAGTPTALFLRGLDNSYAGGFTTGATRVLVDTGSPGGSSAISADLVSLSTAITNVNDTPSGLPIITGVTTEDETLTADTSAITDADGLGAFAYQWLRDGVTVAGATASTYVLGDADVGARIRVTVSYTDGNGTSESVTSAETAVIANVNDTPSGLPVITGTTTEDQTLTIDTSAIADADGTGAFSYQWLRDGVTVGDATASTYVLGDADVGARISVTVNYTDGNGTPESLTSAETAAVVNVNDTPSGLPLITGVTTEDETLTADTSAITDADGLGAFAYQWLRDGVTVAGATASTYVLGDADVGARISVTVSYTDGNGTPESLTSTQTAVIANVNDTPSGLPVITGTTTEDQTLTVDTSAIADADGTGAFSYQWLRDGVTVAGATASSYVLGDADVGARISVAVSYTDGNGTPESVTSTQTAVIANVNDTPSGLPVITGVTTEDETLTADTSAIGDADGLGAFSYEWLRDGVTVAGATASTYVLGDADVGARISVTVSYTDGNGTPESLTSTQTAVIANVNDTPSGLPVITGATTEDQTLTIDTSAIADADGTGTFSYQWLRDGVAAAGATASTYVLGDADVGARIRVTVSYTDGNGTPESLTSTQTAVIANVNDTPSGLPVITGTTTEDQTLTVDTSAIADADGTGAFSYQWLRDGVTVAGATASSYVLGDADVGSRISVTVSYTDGNGTPESVTSAETAAVANVNDAPVLQTNAPLAILEGATALIDASLLQAADVDDRVDELLYSVVQSAAAGRLELAGVAGQTASQFTQADIDAGSVRYVHDGSETLADSFTFVLTDAAGASVGSVSFLINVTPVNDAPVLASSVGGPVTMVAGAAPQPIDPTLTASDPDSPVLTGAVVRIDSHYMMGADRLEMAGNHAVSAAWNAVDGSLTLSGTASAAAYSAALRDVRFATSSALAGMRTLSVAASDGTMPSFAMNRTLVLSSGDSPSDWLPVSPPGLPPVSPSPGFPQDVPVAAPPAQQVPEAPESDGGQPPSPDIAGERASSEQESGAASTTPALLAQPDAAGSAADDGALLAPAANMSSRTANAGGATVMPVSALIDFLMQQMRINDFSGESGTEAGSMDAFGARPASGESLRLAAAGSRSASSLGLLDELIGEVPKEEGTFSFDIEVSPGVTGGLLLSASVLWWATRSGGLLAAMMASVPAWRSFDPLPILARSSAGPAAATPVADSEGPGWMTETPASGAAAPVKQPMLVEMAGGE